MKKINPAIIKSIILLLSLFPLVSFAQFNFYKSYAPLLIHDNDTLDLAWLGGFNNPQFSNIDIDLDGDNDLFVFDRSGDVILLFKAENNAGQVNYIPLTDVISDFPTLSAWTLLLDYNLDGKTDIFTHSDSIAGGGISVFKNIGSAGSPEFELVDGLLETHAEYENASFSIPLYVNLADIPSFIDLDEDGDIDILTFSINGSELEYHENQSQELFNDNEHFIYELKNACWGYFKENSLNNSISLYDTCNTNVINPKSPLQKEGLHVGSTVLGIDLDGDDVKDLLVGDISGTNIISLHNGGTTQSGIITSFETEFPPNTVSIDMQIFPSPFYTDINNDGLNELIVAPNAPNTANNFSSTWLYGNNGSNESPVFNWEEFAFMQDEMIDRGSNALPAIFDYNSDGKKDLVVANKSFYTNTSEQFSRLALYENTSTGNEISFELIDEDYLNLDDLGLSLALYPAFGDMDNDMDEDLIVGDLNGQIHYFENTAGPGNTANFSLAIPGITDQNGDLIDVGQFATPFMVDLNRDGKMDLVIGERSGTISYYENTGTSNVFEFTLIDDTFGGIQMPGDLNEGFSVPFIIDSESGYQLFVGSNNGEVVHFFPIEDDLTGDFEVLNENILPFYEGKRTGVVMADLDGNSDLEMFVGNYRGGIGFYDQANPDGISKKEKIAFPFTISPNPSNGHFYIKVENEFSYNYQIINTLGQVILDKKQVYGNQSVRIETLPGGVYYIRIYTDSFQSMEALIISK